MISLKRAVVEEDGCPRCGTKVTTKTQHNPATGVISLVQKCSGCRLVVVKGFTTRQGARIYMLRKKLAKMYAEADDIDRPAILKKINELERVKRDMELWS